jgi:hypothetical protein
VFEEADSDLVSPTVAVGARASTDLLAFYRGGFDCRAKVLVGLYVGCAVYDSCIIVDSRIDQMVKFPAIRVNDRDVL